MSLNDTVVLKLLAEERQLLLDIIILDESIEEKLRCIVAGKQGIELSLEELEELGGYVAAEANHCEDRKREKILDRIWEKIEDLLAESDKG